MEYSKIEKELQEILDQGDFSRLAFYLEDQFWGSMTFGERQLLALLLLTYGEQLLFQADNEAMVKFDLALKIAPESALVFYRLGLAYISQLHNVRCLVAASQSFEAAVNLDQSFYDAWIAWGKTLTQLSLLHSDPAYLEEALKKFIKASECLPQNANCGPLYWSWGACWMHYAKHTGEALEVHYALEKYRQASESGFGLQHAEFWIDYGNAIAEMSTLLDRSELMLEAIEFYRTAIKVAPEYYDGWHQLALACQKVFEVTKEEAYYSFSTECYSRAAEINSQDPALWLNWGFLVLELGKVQRSTELYKKAYEKFECASKYEDNHHLILLRMAEAQMLWGAQEERLDLLKEAEAKIVRSLEVFSDEPIAWVIYGTCLSELGDYFEDGIYYLRALEKFQYGLSLDEKHPLIWYGLALTTYALGELNDDLETIEKSLTYYVKVHELGSSFPQFWNDWGIALMQLAEMTSEVSHVEAAIEKFTKALAIQKDGPIRCVRPQEVGWLYNYACAHDYLARLTEDALGFEKAIQLLIQTLEYNPSFLDARYNLAIAHAHLAEETDDLESYHKALEQYQLLVQEECEDDAFWHDYALTLMDMASMLHDPLYPERSLKIYQQAEDKLHHALVLGHPEASYTLACLYSVLGKYSTSMYFIEKCEALGTLPSIDDLMHEDWLHEVRQTAAFKSFISLLLGSEQE